MKPSICLVLTESLGDLYIMPKPSGERLYEDVSYYRSLGVDVIISMLKNDEENDLGLQDEAKICRQHQIQFLQLEILDLGLPSLAPFTKLVDEVAARLIGGKTVAVHCRAGIGRSGMLVCCVLIRLGFTAEDAIKHVTKARGVAIPDTDEQIAFIYQFAAAH